jgi:hypothetical protein
MTDRKAVAREFLEALEIKMLADSSWKTPWIAAKSEEYQLGYGRAILDIETNIIRELKKRMEEQNDDGE